jgi:DNA-binding MarR family transcriptional regulator
VVTRPSDTRLLVLHGLRLKGFAGASDVAEMTSVTPAEVNRHLDELQADELVLYRDGRLTGWALTPAGRAEHERVLAEELAALGCRAVVRDAYGRFLELNPELLTVCTAWQMKDEATLNAHDDEDYDRGVVDQLGDVHDRVQPVLADLRNALDRYQSYQPRFCNALVRVQSGDHDWFAKPMIDSYHTVWFQLHEDLLNTLGIERSKEAAR